MRYRKSLWVVVLAGGNGERLLPMTTERFGRPVPKQFCRLDGRESMLGITLARARGLTESGRIAVAVLEEHREWWERELAGIDAENVIRQAQNRGTGFALHAALLHIQASDPHARVVVLPSDHMVDDEGILQRAIREALDAVEEDSRSALAVGAAQPLCPGVKVGTAGAGTLPSLAATYS